MKILVIEDEDTIRDTLQELLELENFQVVTAENGLIGVQMAQAERPDLVICDVMMPELDGYEVLAQLHQKSETATIPFIFLTAKASLTDVRQGMNLGADDYLTKPFTLAELRQAIAVRLTKQANLMDQYWQERDRSQQLQRQAQDQQNVAEVQEDLLKKMVLELRNPLSNISITPALSTIAQPNHDIGRHGVELLVQSIARGSPPGAGDSLCLPYRFCGGESCAAAAGPAA